MPRGSSWVVVAALAITVTACGSGSSSGGSDSGGKQQVMKLRNDSAHTVQVARCQANHCDPAKSLAAQATLTVRMAPVQQGSPAVTLRIRSGGGSQCVLVPPATQATAGKTFYVSVSQAGPCD
jgi:hypothetical protein